MTVLGHGEAQQLVVTFSPYFGMTYLGLWGTDRKGIRNSSLYWEPGKTRRLFWARRAYIHTENGAFLGGGGGNRSLGGVWLVNQDSWVPRYWP